jgi:predicted nucleotidyltransferase
VLFGSRARGDARPDSDLDIMVEMETDKPFYERMVEVDKVFGLRSWPMDLVVYSRELMAVSYRVRDAILPLLTRAK